MAGIHFEHETFAFGIVGAMNIKYLEEDKVCLEVPSEWIAGLRRSVRREKNGFTISLNDQGALTSEERVQTGWRRTPVTDETIRIEMVGPNAKRVSVGRYREATKFLAML